MGSYFSNIYNMLQFLGILCFVFLLGSITTLSIVGYFFHRYLNFSSILYKKSSSKFTSIQFSDILKENLLKSNSSVESCNYLNLLLAFIFREWRDTASVQRWIVKKINVEIEELLETKAARRLLNAVNINDIDLGSSPPIINGASIKEPFSYSSDEVPDRVIVDIDVVYEGQFYLAVDVDLRFGKSAFVSISVKRLKGQLRLQFNRLPCTHWSVCFVNEPILDIKIDTNFLSRPLPQLGSLILNQVYRTIRRKHTFPRHKIRYTPFNAFWIDHMNCDNCDEIKVRLKRIETTIVSCTRLLLPHAVDKRKDSGVCSVLFATVSLDPVSCVGLEPRRQEPSDSKKNNFLLTSISDALNEVDENVIKKMNSDLSGIPMKEDSEPLLPAGPESNTNFPPSAMNNGTSSLHVSIEKNSKSAKSLPSERIPPKIVLQNSGPPVSVDGCDDNNNNEKKIEFPTVDGLKRSLKELGSGTSYMMVTRNFSAVLSEEVSTRIDGSLCVNVLVGSIVWNRSARMKATISEGDKILSINGRSVHSLSQAIAIINDIRSQKSRFYFKVQRNRRRSRGASMRSTRDSDGTRSRSASSPVHFPFDDSPSSDDADEPVPEDDTESDFSDLDTEDQESFADEGSIQKRKNNFLTPSSSPFHDVIDDSSDRVTSQTSLVDEIKFAQIFPSSTTYKTSFCDSSQSTYSWPNDVFSFDVNDAHEYLNVRFWYKEVSTTSSLKKDNLTLVGALGVPLHFLQRHCCMMTSGNFTRRYKVFSPLALDSDVRRTAERIFKQRSGFKLEHCYGDVTISTKADFSP